MEIQNQNEGYMYRGLVKTICIENNELQATFAWLAKGEGFPPLPNKWVKDGRLDYAASLEIYSASNIDPSGGEVGGSDRLCLNSFITGETVVLYPPDGSKLDSDKVEGLEKAYERLLALYPDIAFDREIAKKVFAEKSWPQQAEALAQLHADATLRDLLGAFRHDSSREEFLWFYVEAVTGEKDVHRKIY